MYYLGCPLWANDKWRGQLYSSTAISADFLAQYSRYFNAVEGNTTFYADPSAQTLTRWLQQSATNFRFCLKVPQAISHHAEPKDRLALLQQWLVFMQPFQAKLGLVHLQFPASADAKLLDELPLLLQAITTVAGAAVEVRHPCFFDKGAAEQQLHQVLRAHAAERVILDSRSLFAKPASTPALQDAWQKKPRLPVHVTAIGNAPMFRFIGVADLAHNQRYYQPWLHKMAQWLAEGKTPYAFFHTEDNHTAPLLARQFASDLATLTGVSHPVLAAWPFETEPQQNTLF